MAVDNICAKLLKDLDVGCIAPPRKFWQQAVLINKADIDPDSVTIGLPDYDSEPATCDYTVEFDLKCETTGIMVKGIESGNNFKGLFSKSNDDNGYPTYNHQVQIFVGGADKDVACFLDAMDKGSYVVALQLKDGTVLIYGFGNGLTTGDYDYDLAENGGGAPVMLQSQDDSPEGYLPFVYVSNTPGDEEADFNSKFAGVDPCP